MTRPHSYINMAIDSANSLYYPLASALLLILALPWVGLGPIVLVALIPLFLFLTDPRVSRLRAYTFGGGAILLYMLCAVYPLMQVEGSWWVGTRGLNKIVSENTQYLMLVILTAVWHTLVFLPVIPVARKFISHTWGVPLTAFVWVLLEWGLTNFGLWGYSIGILGYSLADTSIIKNVAAYTSVYGLSFVAVYVSAAIAHLLQKHRRSPVTYAWVKEPLITVFFAVLFLLQLLVVRDGFEHGEGKTLRIALIGTSLSTDASIGSTGYASYREKMQTAFTHDPDLMLLPENAFPYFELNESDGALVKNSLINFPGRDDLYQDLLALSRAHASTTLAIGLHTYREGKHYNSLVLYRAGSPIGYYEKRVLVPFTEYVPFSLPIPMYVRFAPGPAAQSLEANGTSWNALICSEVADTNIALQKGSPILVSSNDSIFPGAAAGVMHQEMAKVRAIENDAYILRATKGGITSIIDPHGNVIAQTTDGVLVGDIPSR